ncbi:MAG: sulfite exporter TauE/SafE family protein [Bacteroidota bacterium]
MSVETLLILIAIGLFAGAFSGMVGIGGGVIIIPALVYFVGFSQHQAQGTSLAIMLPPIGLMAAYQYYKAGHVNLTYALIIASAFFIGGYFGAKYAVKMPQDLLKKIFGVFLILVALKTIFGK